VGVPRSVAAILTYPERVTNFNIDKMNEYVQRGPTEHPGAKYIIQVGGAWLPCSKHWDPSLNLLPAHSST